MKIRERILIWFLGDKVINDLASESRMKVATLERVAFLTCRDEIQRLSKNCAINIAFQRSVDQRIEDLERRVRRLADAVRS